MFLLRAMAPMRRSRWEILQIDRLSMGFEHLLFRDAGGEQR
jgi:hypothetical protein